MDCPQCGSTNTAGSRYCEECGAPLVRDGIPASEPEFTTVSPLTAATLFGVGDRDGEVFELGSRAVIGRLDTCDVTLDDKSVSREHARLSRLRNGFLIEDLGSTNGTLVNGRKINDAVLLRSEDRITIGSIELRFTASPQVDGEEADHMSENLDAAPEEFERSIAEIPEPPVETEELHESAVATDLPDVGVTFPPLHLTSNDQPEAEDAEVRGQAVDEVRPVLHRLHDLALKHATQLDALREEQRRLRQQLRDVGNARSVLNDIPQLSISDGQLREMGQLLESLAAQPRDVEVLVKLGQHGAALALVVQEYALLREHLAVLTEPSSPPGSTGRR